MYSMKYLTPLEAFQKKFESAFCKYSVLTVGQLKLYICAHVSVCMEDFGANATYNAQNHCKNMDTWLKSYRLYLTAACIFNQLLPTHVHVHVSAPLQGVSS